MLRAQVRIPLHGPGSLRACQAKHAIDQVDHEGISVTLGPADFARALRIAHAVPVGMRLQFTVMPLLGWSIARSFGLRAEIAAGIILIRSRSGGVALNVMAILVKGSVALSVSMTACSTPAAPFMTPLVLRVLAGRFIEIDFETMM